MNRLSSSWDLLRTLIIWKMFLPTSELTYKEKSKDRISIEVSIKLERRT